MQIYKERLFALSELKAYTYYRYEPTCTKFVGGNECKLEEMQKLLWEKTYTSINYDSVVLRNRGKKILYVA